jgi:hypothetical protein
MVLQLKGSRQGVIEVHAVLRGEVELAREDGGSAQEYIVPLR